MELRALLIDSDDSARKELYRLLQSFADVQIVGEAANASEALDLMKTRECAVIFLDLATTNLTGSDLAHLWQNQFNAPRIIFTAAQEEYAFAFAVNALDFLAKPISAVSLQEVLQEVRQLKDDLAFSKTSNSALPPVSASRPGTLDVIPVEQKGRIIILHPEDIIFVYTDKDNVYIKTQSDAYLTRFTLRELEARLNPVQFFRCHRCYLVNTRRMKELTPYLNGTYTIIMDDAEQSEIPMSRTKSRVLKEMLGL